jgi:sulfide dehydrogenase cytochrome subunit
MIPTLAGIGAFYLENQFAVFEARARPCTVEVSGDSVDKCALVATLDKAQRRAVADYYSSFQYRPVEQDYDSALAEAGAVIHSARCARCHTEDGRQPLDDSGLLAGQPIAYLRRQLESFIDGSRWQPKSMAPETEDLDADDIEALAHFYAKAGSGFDNDQDP